MQNPDRLNNKLEQLILIGDKAEMVAFVDACLKNKEFNEQHRLVLAQALVSIGDLEKAKTVYHQYLLTTPKDTLAHFQLGMVFYENSEYSEAIDIWLSVSESSDEYAQALFYQALASLKLGDIEATLSLCLQIKEKYNANDKILAEATRLLKHIQSESKKLSNVELNAQQLEDHKLGKRFGRVLFQRDSPFGRITVGDDAYQAVGNRALFINHRDMCSTLNHVSEDYLGAMVADFLPKNSRVLNVGLGCGFTAAAIAESENVLRLDVVEINPIIIEANRLFSEFNNHIQSNSKISIHLDDGFKWLDKTKATYDAILVDVEEPVITHSADLFTLEFFEKTKMRLAENGICALWSLYTMKATAKILQETMRRVFSNVQLKIFGNDREGNSGHIIVFGSMCKPLTLPAQSEDELALIAKISTLDTLDVNTQNQKKLTGHYDLNNAFSLPYDYSDDLTKKPD